ncbi:MAG: glycosyltransferase [Desulfobulbaceae bacterium]|nr:glycosyltransferase [Desulfobulbaceae bacterium]
MDNLFRKILRSASCWLFRFGTKYRWDLLRYYPHVIPDDDTMHRWQRSEWPEYQQWIDRHSLLTSGQWREQHELAKKDNGKIKITVITPVFNTDPRILEECILSVRTQTTPFWEFILIDDKSTSTETKRVLKSRICKDPRIRILYTNRDSSKGISVATNKGLQAARGDYIVFLDHDDRLAPEAIQSLIAAIREDPEADIIYSDRDMISLGDKRFMHLMKPDWSPENLYAGNYIFHLMCYRKELIFRAGNLRSEYDGSQDYDLILRCMELSPIIKHLPQVLYHWRQHVESVAMLDDAKNYAFEAGMAALRDALRRRKIMATVSENKSLWRGNYEIQLPLPPPETIGYITLPETLEADQYAAAISSDPVLSDPPPYIYIQWEGCSPAHEDSAGILASWLALENIGMVSGRLLDENRKILYGGMIYGDNGEIFAPYEGFDETESGYMAATQAVRNISAPCPCGVMFRRELWQQLNGFDSRFQGPYALLDFALLALQSHWRIVYVPRAVFTCDSSCLKKNIFFPEQNVFHEKWRYWLQKGDPYYSPNLKKNSINYKLA